MKHIACNCKISAICPLHSDTWPFILYSSPTSTMWHLIHSKNIQQHEIRIFRKTDRHQCQDVCAIRPHSRQIDFKKELKHFSWKKDDRKTKIDSSQLLIINLYNIYFSVDFWILSLQQFEKVRRCKYQN